jgi:hypothetical protein|tara:strand:- start:4359 stop:4661 length:303 start_codon:yes stop_codon:yes gene_type:complete
VVEKKAYTKLSRDIIYNKDNLNRLVIIEWFDPYDESDEITIDTLNVQRATYESCGFLMGVSNDHVVIGYNKDMSEKGKYKGYGNIPMSLITNAHLMDRNC